MSAAVSHKSSTSAHLVTDTKVPTTHVDTLPAPPDETPKVVILGPPSSGTIGQRRRLSRAMKSMAQRQLKKVQSGTLRHRRSHRDFSLDRSRDSSLVDSRRAQFRAQRAKRVACRRSDRTKPGAEDCSVAKRTSVDESELVFFGEFKANPSIGYACVVC